MRVMHGLCRCFGEFGADSRATTSHPFQRDIVKLLPFFAHPMPILGWVVGVEGSRCLVAVALCVCKNLWFTCFARHRLGVVSAMPIKPRKVGN
eukprot:4932127-Amphidinium_carterae.1